ncbi:MAG: DUF2505 domain-containing protein [Dermatophilaceae bacterium]
MRLTLREDLAAAPDAVYAVLIDRSFHDAKCAATSEGGSYTTDITPRVTGHRVRTERDLPATGLPDVARSFVGDRLTVVEVLEWIPDGGGHRAALTLHVSGAPLTLTGTLTLGPSGAGSTECLDAELRATVPFIGAKIERSAAVPIRAAFDIEIELLRTWLTR